MKLDTLALIGSAAFVLAMFARVLIGPAADPSPFLALSDLEGGAK